MIKLEVYDRVGVLWTSKLEFIPDTINPGLFKDRDDIEEYIKNMDIPAWRKTGYLNRIWVVLDQCYPKHFYRLRHEI